MNGENKRNERKQNGLNTDFPTGANCSNYPNDGMGKRSSDSKKSRLQYCELNWA